MCMISYVSQPYAEKWTPYTIGDYTIGEVGVSKLEFDQLKNEVAALKDLMKAAKVFDSKTGNEDCQHEDKVAIIRRVAELVGVDMSDVLGEPK